MSPAKKSGSRARHQSHHTWRTVDTPTSAHARGRSESGPSQKEANERAPLLLMGGRPPVQRQARSLQALAPGRGQPCLSPQCSARTEEEAGVSGAAGLGASTWASLPAESGEAGSGPPRCVLCVGDHGLTLSCTLLFPPSGGRSVPPPIPRAPIPLVLLRTW